MKILLISDAHANIDALRVLDETEKDYDDVWFAGDMVDYGFHPHEVIAWMREHDVKAVYGNHDESILKLWDSGFVRKEDPLTAESFAEYNLSVMTDEDIAYLRTLPENRTFRVFGNTYYMEHIYHNSHSNDLYDDMKRYDFTVRFDRYWEEKVGACEGEHCYVIGDSHHCHVIQAAPARSVLNPGSLAYRLGADTSVKGMDYMVLEDGVAIPKYARCDSSYCLDLVERSSFREWERNVGKAIFSK